MVGTALAASPLAHALHDPLGQAQETVDQTASETETVTAGSDPSSSDDCPTQQDPSAVSAGPYYVKESHTHGIVTVQVWAETNGAAGLQTSPTPCGWNEPSLPADALVSSFSTFGSEL